MAEIIIWVLKELFWIKLANKKSKYEQVYDRWWRDWNLSITLSSFKFFFYSFFYLFIFLVIFGRGEYSRIVDSAMPLNFSSVFRLFLIPTILKICLFRIPSFAWFQKRIQPFCFVEIPQANSYSERLLFLSMKRTNNKKLLKQR